LKLSTVKNGSRKEGGISIYIAIELAQADTFEEQKANLERSLEYLKSKGFIAIK
jgi:hypothetical protein